MVKWISQQSSELSFQVRILVDAQDLKKWTALLFQILVQGGAMFLQ